MLNAARRLVAPLVLLALLLPAAACSSNPADTPPSPSASPKTQVPERDPTAAASPDATPVTGDDGIAREAMTIRTAAGGTVRLFAELAQTPEERAQGLMGRLELAPDSGMLFVIEPPGRGFWMKDTTVALTIAFIAACGEIVELIDMEPLSEEIRNASQPYAFALEMERGWFAANGVVAGDVVELPPRLLAAEC